MTKRAKLLAGALLPAVGLVCACSAGNPNPKAQALPAQAAPQAAAAAPVQAGNPAESKEARQLTRYARLLAGVDDREAAPDDPLRRTDAFRAHAREMSQLWTAYEKNEADKIRPWAEKELTAVRGAQTLFYPFAGADFLWAHAFFSGARTMVLVGLERVGALADLETLPARGLEEEYARIEKAVTPVIKASFFNTLEMQSDTLKDGLVTVFVTLMAGTDHRILALDTVSLWKDGRVAVREKTDPPSTPSGARIQYVAEGETEPRTLYYFRTDLANAGLARQGGLLVFADTLPDKVGFAKAASYTMHGGEFSTIRNYLLDQTRAVLQDDTGIPLRYYDRTKWDLRFFGHYTGPITEFANYRQKDLLAAFADPKNVGPLDFHIGYGASLLSNLTLAVKKEEGRK